MALILDDDSLLDAADGFAGWDDALVDDTLAQELEQELSRNAPQSWKANWSRTNGPLTTTPNWRTRRKKPPPPAKNG